MLFFVLCFHVLVVSTLSKELLIQSNDKLLFIGGTNTLLGSGNPFGFVNLFTAEAKLLNLNISVFNAGAISIDNSALLQKLQNGLLAHFAPNKLILMPKMKYDNEGISSLPNIRYEIESLVAYLVGLNLDVVLCSLDLNGEASSDIGEDLIVEDLVWFSSQLARDHSIMHVDLQSVFLKYLENTNVDNLSHSVLTMDGTHLNERGHALVAQVLAQRLLYGTNAAQQPVSSIQGSSLLSDNAAIREKKRVKSQLDAVQFAAEQDQLLRDLLQNNYDGEL